MTKTIFNHDIIPKEGQDMLKAAARIQGGKTRDEAIDAAAKQIRTQYPHLYHPQPIVELPELQGRRAIFAK